MGKVLDEIGSSEAAFIAKQNVFFVATAPLDKNYHVNLSPKAPGSSLVVLGPHKVAYADLTGSGAETAAHVLENKRMTLMFCNLEEGPPKILRLHGTAELIIKEHAQQSLIDKFPESLTQSPGFRAIFVLTVERISSSCGYSLPVMTYEKTRTTLEEYTQRKGVEGMHDYCLQKNSFSIDGLPSVAQLRNPNVAITPKLEDGYIYGEAVSAKDDAGSPAKSKLISYEKVAVNGSGTGSTKSLLVNSMFGVALFAAGTLFGLFISSSDHHGTKAIRASRQ